MSNVILNMIETIALHRSVLRTDPIWVEKFVIDSTYEEVSDLWSKGDEQAERRDLLSKSSLSQRGFFVEERAGGDCAPADRQEQSVGAGFISRRKPVADGIDSAPADRADAVADADAG